MMAKLNRIFFLFLFLVVTNVLKRKKRKIENEGRKWWVNKFTQIFFIIIFQFLLIFLSISFSFSCFFSCKEEKLCRLPLLKIVVFIKRQCKYPSILDCTWEAILFTWGQFVECWRLLFLFLLFMHLALWKIHSISSSFIAFDCYCFFGNSLIRVLLNNTRKFI